MSAVAHWLHYLAWCALTSDPSCRPFVGLLALLGASAGALTILLLVLHSMLHAPVGERAEVRKRRDAVRERRPQLAPPVVAPETWRALGAALTLAPHAEPVLGEPVERRDEVARPPGTPR